MLPIIDLPPQAPQTSVVVERHVASPGNSGYSTSTLVGSPNAKLADAQSSLSPYGVQRAIGWCTPMENHPDDPVVGNITIDLIGAAANYLFYFDGKKTVSDTGAIVTVLLPPAHGRLIGKDAYVPEPSFHGQDKIEALVELGGYKVRVVYVIPVVGKDQRVGDDEASIKKHCGPNGSMWKISGPASAPNKVWS